MRLFTLTISVLFASLFISSCKSAVSSDCKKFGLNKNVQSVQVKTYEAENKFGEIMKGDIDENNYIAVFNENGNLTSITRFDEDGDLSSKKVYEYNDDNLCTKQSIYNWDGYLIYAIEQVYDGKNLVKKNEHLSWSGDETTEYKFNGDAIQEHIRYTDGEISETAKYLESSSTRQVYVAYDNEGNETIKVQNEYDKDGNLIKYTITKGAEETTATYTYNKDGFLTSLSTSDYSGEVKYNEQNLPVYIKNGTLYCNTDVDLDYGHGIYYIDYEYDDQGNWIKQIIYVGEVKRPYTISERTIVY